MPVIKRSVEPIYVSRGEIPRDAKNGLEAVAVNTLSGVIYQLSSLAYHAENIFGELFKEATGIFERTCNAQKRIDQLAVKVTKLDSAEEEISLQDINLQKAFKMTIHYDTQVTARSTIPDAMLEVYQNSEPVPDLDSLNKFREDGKMSLKFYTDPNYFFELWKEKINKELETRKKKKKKGRVRKQREEGKRVKDIQKKQTKFVPDWELKPAKTRTVVTETMPSSERERPPSGAPHKAAEEDMFPPPPPDLSPTHPHMQMRTSSSSSVERPTSVPPPPPPMGWSPSKSPAPPPPPIPGGMGGSPHHQPNVPPPPPPPQMQSSSSGFPPLPQPAVGPPPPPPPPIGQGIAPPPPPPPPVSGAPPPPPLPTGAPIPPPLLAGGPAPQHLPPPQQPQGLVIPTEPKLRHVQPPEPEPEEDSRNDLLAAIRKGMELKKVQERKLNETKEDRGLMDVASILARRIAFELTDSEDEDDDGDDSWSDDS